MLQQQQRRQPHDLAFGREQLQQQPRQPDRLLAERQPDMRLAAACRIAFVEEEIDHRRDDAEARRPLRRIRRLVGHRGRGDAPLGARDALLHRAFRGEEGAGDLPDRQAGHDAQRQRDLLVGGKLGVAADEQQPEHVVGVVLVVEALGHRRLRIAEIGDQSPRAAAPAALPCGGSRRARRCGRRRSARPADRAAGRSAASSSALSATLPGRLPRRYRDCGSSAAARRWPVASPRSSCAPIQAISLTPARPRIHTA